MKPKKPKEVRTVRIDPIIHKLIKAKYGTLSNFINKCIDANINVDLKPKQT